MVKKLLASFDNITQGFSARKLTAFGFFNLVIYLHYVESQTKSNLVMFLIVDSLMILSLLSVITAQKLISKYIDNNPKQSANE